MLNSVNRGNNWKSFRLRIHTTEANGNGPFAHSTTECSDLTPDVIVDLNIVEASLEEIVVTGVRLSRDHLSRFDTAWTSLNDLNDGEIPIKLFNKYLEALEKAFEDFEKNLKDCLLGHFPELENENVTLVVQNVGEAFRMLVTMRGR